MSLRSILTKSNITTLVRNIHTSPRVQSGHDTRGVFGSNVPFPVKNRHALLAVFVVFFGSGISMPFISIRSMILAKQSG